MSQEVRFKDIFLDTWDQGIQAQARMATENPAPPIKIPFSWRYRQGLRGKIVRQDEVLAIIWDDEDPQEVLWPRDVFIEAVDRYANRTRSIEKIPPEVQMGDLAIKLSQDSEDFVLELNEIAWFRVEKPEQ